MENSIENKILNLDSESKVDSKFKDGLRESFIKQASQVKKKPKPFWLKFEYQMFAVVNLLIVFLLFSTFINFDRSEELSIQNISQVAKVETVVEESSDITADVAQDIESFNEQLKVSDESLDVGSSFEPELEILDPQDAYLDNEAADYIYSDASNLLIENPPILNPDLSGSESSNVKLVVSAFLFINLLAFLFFALFRFKNQKKV